MKDHLTPRSGYDGASGYPAAPGPDRSRRAFLGQAITGAAVLAGLAGPRARAAPPPDRAKVSLDLDAYTPIAGTNLRFRSVDVFTSDRDLARFLSDRSHRAQLRMAALGPLRLATAQTLQSGKAIYRLERQVADRLLEQYRTRTRRRAAPPDVMLHVGERWAVRTGGVVVRPSYGRP